VLLCRQLAFKKQVEFGHGAHEVFGPVVVRALGVRLQVLQRQPVDARQHADWGQQPARPPKQAVECR